MRLLIDTDPGVDDGVALVMALRDPAVTVEAITIVQGNAGLSHNVRNARLVNEVCGAAVPVYAGAWAPIARPALRRPSWIHGRDGFGDLGQRPRRRTADAGFAADRIAEVVMAAPGEITIVTLGPLTNIALALAREPRLAAAARALVMMGGAARSDTAAAEFNVHADPEAARVVLRAGFALTMVGIELGRGAARLTDEDVNAVAALETKPAGLVAALLRHSLSVAACRPMRAGESGASCPDAMAMAVALDAAVLTEHLDAHVDVETRGDLTTGMTVVDWLGTSGHPPNARLGLAVDAVRFKRLLTDRCR